MIKPQPIELRRTVAGEGWFAWGPIANLNGAVSYRERITVLSSGTGTAIWLGTSHGRLLSFESGRWSIQAQFDGIQLTGIAVESATRIWVSTSDGIRLLDSVDGQWKPTEFRDYFEGHPSFVSGGYFPGEDAVRLWAYASTPLAKEAGAIEEIEPSTVLVGIGDEPSELPAGLVKLDGASRRSPRSKGRNTRFARSPQPRMAGSSPPPGGRCMRRRAGGYSDGWECVLPGAMAEPWLARTGLALDENGKRAG